MRKVHGEKLRKSELLGLMGAASLPVTLVNFAVTNWGAF